MPRHIFAAAVPLLLLLTGCVEDARRLLVSSAPPGQPVPTPPATQLVQRAPATEKVAERVLVAGQKLVLANQQMGMRPIFITVGAPHPEIFHRGGKEEGYQVFVSEGLVKGCVSDDQLAAVLSVELGKMVAERDSVLAVAGPGGKREVPPGERIGSDAGGAFGSSDGTRMMELAKMEQSRKKARRAVPVSPEVLAKGYLQKAGYDVAAAGQVANLLRKAEDHCAVEKQVRGAAAP